MRTKYLICSKRFLNRNKDDLGKDLKTFVKVSLQKYVEADEYAWDQVYEEEKK